MEYKDEQILSIEQYETIAKAYCNALKKRGYKFIKVENEKNQELIEQTFITLSKIKTCLFLMGGFLNTSSLYSLNERQIKKLRIILDYESPLKPFQMKHDKTMCFIKLIGFESELIKLLLILEEESNFENEIKKMIDDRLTLFSTIFTDNKD